MASPSGSANGGIVGVKNNASFGRCFVTETKTTGNFTTQPGTGFVEVLTIAGGG